MLDKYLVTKLVNAHAYTLCYKSYNIALGMFLYMAQYKNYSLSL